MSCSRPPKTQSESLPEVLPQNATREASQGYCMPCRVSIEVTGEATGAAQWMTMF